MIPLDFIFQFGFDDSTLIDKNIPAAYRHDISVLHVPLENTNRSCHKCETGGERLVVWYGLGEGMLDNLKLKTQLIL
jgi:hypothetical protein